MLIVREVPGGVTFSVRIEPGSLQDGAVETDGGAAKIAIGTPTVDEAANEALVHLLAHLLQVSQRSVSVLSGHTLQCKLVRVDGITSEQLFRYLGSTSNDLLA